MGLKHLVELRAGSCADLLIRCVLLKSQGSRLHAVPLPWVNLSPIALPGSVPHALQAEAAAGRRWVCRHMFASNFFACVRRGWHVFCLEAHAPCTHAPLLLQGVYNAFIRPTLAPEELLVLPCDEANGHEGSGYPGLPSNCSGRFVSHFWGWGGHEKATAAFRKQILRYAQDAMLYHASSRGQLQEFN